MNKFRVIFRESIVYPVEVEAENFEEAAKLAEMILKSDKTVQESTGIELESIRVVNPGEAPIFDGIFDHYMVKQFLMDGDENTDQETIKLWNNLFEYCPDKIIYSDLDDLFDRNFDSVEDFIKHIKSKHDIDGIDLSADYFWIDEKTGAIFSGCAGEAVDLKIDFDEMADKLIKTRYKYKDELKEHIKTYNRKYHLL